jgi:L-amino acid N-acyltransferase YncA
MQTIRAAIESDVLAITDIYNEAVLNTTATFDTDTKSLEDRLAWFRNHDDKHPIIVAEIAGTVVGWGSLSRWSERVAYDTTAEASVYVHVDHRQKGIGKQLLEVLILEGERVGLHSIISRVTSENEVSMRLNEIFQFEKVGILKEVGRKFDRFLDVHIMQVVFKN